MFKNYYQNFEDVQYHEITDEQILHIIKKIPSKIKERYFQQRILNILNTNTVCNNYINRNQITKGRFISI